MDALVVGRSAVTAWPIPHLLARAGFRVDVITRSRLLSLSKFVRDVRLVEDGEMVAEVADGIVRDRAQPYDLVVVTDDPTLADFVALERRSGSQAKLLPLVAEASRDHIYSKIGLSRTLAAAGIKTPPFGIARNNDEAGQIARDLGFPVFIKVNASTAGQGVQECDDIAAIANAQAFDGPMLVQKAIDGAEHKISAIFFEGRLVHFDYGVVLRRQEHFGPSVIRSFRPATLLDASVFEELGALGRALGAHGFVNISCIDAADGSGRHYIEADMRPNVWADFALYFGEDPALRIRNWFAQRASMTRENAVAPGAPPTVMDIPHFWRLTPFELATNRYGVWRYIPLADTKLVLAMVAWRLGMGAGAFARSLVPGSIRRAMRR